MLLHYVERQDVINKPKSAGLRAAEAVDCSKTSLAEEGS